MSDEPRKSDQPDGIQSLSLEDLVAGRRPWWRRALNDTRLAVPAASLLVFAVVSAGAAYLVWSGPEESAILVIDEPAPVHTGSVGSVETASAGEEPAAQPLAAPAEIEAARLPRPRPHYEPRYAEVRVAYPRASDPCQALQAMGVYLPFRVYCVSDPRPAPAYRHGPYAPYPR